MSYSKDEQLFWELLDLSDAELIVDNDMCIISYNFSETEQITDSEHQPNAFHRTMQRLILGFRWTKRREE